MAAPLPHDSSDAAFSWFTEFQRSGILKNGIVPEWFHGIISRKAAEEMLMSKPPGYFLIRVSESRVGYTLSYRADDRCRHFMIDVLPDNQFIIVGEQTPYCSLYDLVAFHRRNPILPYNELLTVACEQGDKNNYVTLLFPRRKELNHAQVEWINSSTITPNSNTSEQNPTFPPQSEFTSRSAKLYPSLEKELTNLNLQSTDQPAKPIVMPRTIFTSKTPTEETPPQLPPRMGLPVRQQTASETEKPLGVMAVSSDRHQIAPNVSTEGRPQQKHQQQLNSVVLSLANIKKKLKKKRSEDHTYEEIVDDSCQEDMTFPVSESSGNMNPKEPEENNYQEISECSTGGDVSNFVVEELPFEYLNPPPFAPGY